jgi:hypothetical protein
MKRVLVRSAIAVLETLIALSAIGGGIALLAGTYRDGFLIEAGGQARFPLEWLQNTPFSDYTLPAFILIIGVGGSSFLASILLFTDQKAGIIASVAAGLTLTIFISAEVAMLRQGISWIEGIYFALGLLICGLAIFLWRLEYGPHLWPINQD